MRGRAASLLSLEESEKREARAAGRVMTCSLLRLGSNSPGEVERERLGRGKDRKEDKGEDSSSATHI